MIANLRADTQSKRVRLCARILFASPLALNLLLTACGGGGGGGSSGSSSAPSGSSSYQVGGTLTGLSSGTSVTLKNGSDSLMLNSNGSFVFPTHEASGSTYDVTVGTEPALPEHCSVSQGSGTVNGANVTSVAVACTQTLTETVLYRFMGSASDGEWPYAGLMMDGSGDLFGTTVSGGSGGCTNGCGTVFELKPNGSGGYTETVLYNFGTNANDGTGPDAGLVADSSGDLFGTTASGGSSSGYGTVFELKPNGSGGYTEAVLYRFTGPGDGEAPVAGLIMDGSGDLFGTTEQGGASDEGMVFELIPNGTSYAEVRLYSFGSNAVNDGARPYGDLIMDSSGDLFGTTAYGGSGSHGTVFELTSNNAGYTESVLYAFKGGLTDGVSPYAGLIMDSSGDLFGTTASGGSGSCTGGCGTVFELKSNGTSYAESVLYTFGSNGGGNDGANPYAGLIMDGSGDLFGTTSQGGTAFSGTVFELKPNGTSYAETVLHSFASNGVDGGVPYSYGSLIQNVSGDLFGTTASGGSSSGYGTVFEIQ